ncbi:Bromodomain associated domain protein [Drechmeria coniospora]|uniref:Bromodomain associated domain protein n=1 Tax=Drechmeria coniospora TaxID=98403 RepID=A0A151GEM8_DRECN|nr:Bromodomain associated domain protein [Drechmeria coniospora]KYK55533.1 Bromodomain associated domain protein [Drechmeria coniospora]ODA81860.1 hypothetical protein RJ55_00365 [Drechmeria coniospora]
MAGQPAIFHALLRPVILQILRATGYHATKGAVLDSLTDLAARYMLTLCEKTAAHAVHARGDAVEYTVVDLRMALQDAGALMPERTAAEQDWRHDEEDTSGVDEFLAWFSGPMMRELLDVGKGDGESDATDYLSSLKKKHSKAGEDSKWNGTIIGKPLDTVNEVQVEGGPATSIDEWVMQRSKDYFNPQSAPQDMEIDVDGVNTNGHRNPPSPSASSGLSSVGDRLDDAEVDAMDVVGA